MSSYYEKILATGEVKCIDEEVPFEIPQGWEWCRMGCIGDWGAGATPAKGNPDYYGGSILWLRTGELNNGIVYDSEIKITDKALQECSLRMNKIGDVLIAMYGATIGKVAIVGKELTTNQACCACTPFGIYNYYLFFFLMGSQIDFIKKGEGGAQPNISREKLISHLMPIPPLAEQNRIVEKIQRLLPLVEKYSNNQLLQDKLNSEITDKLCKSILQEAIQGKLVPQIREEGTAQELLEQIKEEKQNLVKEGKLKKSALATSVIFRGDDNKYYEQIGSEVTEIELPFDFPSSWSIVRLYAVCQLTDGLKTTGKQCLLDAKYLRGKSSGTIIEQGKLVYKGDNIMLVDGENSGEVFIVPQDGYMGSTFKQLWISSSLYEPYILAFIQFYKETLRNSKKGAAIPHLNKELFYGLIIGIPPFKEQKRIVQKIGLSAQLLK
ncbi:restriction endonuclease subunit S [Prevotella copri]|uniref:restriction endonuclease subunit S n=1 Tax=Segatella copri TaxID=165179 RepID=UPI001C3864ED|nr:restriction endonuclease subunit S [Segatella copri]MBV3402765.1 restriction endonuclease subunit S [Segatella copri]